MTDYEQPCNKDLCISGFLNDDLPLPLEMRPKLLQQGWERYAVISEDHTTFASPQLRIESVEILITEKSSIHSPQKLFIP